VANLDSDEPASPDRGGGLIRVRLDLAYDGTDFSGWARQPGLRTVQGVVEDALATVLRLPTRAALTVAGRTDAGVHARGQVAHVDLPDERWAAHPSPLRALARALPADVCVQALTLAPPGFDARFSALWRRYAYRIRDGVVPPDPLRRREVLWHRRELSEQRLNEASRQLVGLHDFAAFCRFREGGTTVRELAELSWAREGDGPAAVLVATVIADAFCHSMVRALVGALIPVGEGRREQGWPAQVLQRRARDPAVQVVAAQGLTLEEVRYPDAEGLRRRANITRRPRRGQ
jgi:tRNA pseudouridine38-40 synthase